MNSRRHAADLPQSNHAGVAEATVGEILQREADRPLRGLSRELGSDSLFGDAHLQKGLF
jgi:hypothetical protein